MENNPKTLESVEDRLHKDGLELRRRKELMAREKIE